MEEQGPRIDLRGSYAKVDKMTSRTIGKYKLVYSKRNTIQLHTFIWINLRNNTEWKSKSQNKHGMIPFI